MKITVGPDQLVSHTVVSAVADAEDCSPTDLPPLRDTVDTDALDSLFSMETTDESQVMGTLTFDYSKSDIRIWLDRSVTITIS
jgi:hypothetical protein